MTYTAIRNCWSIFKISANTSEKKVYNSNAFSIAFGNFFPIFAHVAPHLKNI